MPKKPRNPDYFRNFVGEMGKFLKISRVIAAIACLLILSLGLVGCTAVLPAVSRWIARVQILPAALAFSLGWFLFWLMVTLIFGRVYCSTICPLGTLMDIFSRLGRRGCGGRPYRYSPPMSRLRLVAFFVALAAIFAEVTVVISLVDPSQAYDRIALNIEKPLLLAGHNIISEAGEFSGWWSLPPVKVVISSFLGLMVAVVTLVLIAFVAWRMGRSICNTICPVGTTLGFISRYSVLHFDIDTDLCTHCRRCEQVCKSSCVNLDDHVVDGSRCVTCFNCVAECPVGAIRYTSDRKQLSIPMMQKTRGRLSRPTAISGGNAVNTRPVSDNYKSNSKK